jgi:hypothetical protein
MGRHHGSVVTETTSHSKFSEGVMAKDSCWSLNIAFGMQPILGFELFDKGREVWGIHASFSSWGRRSRAGR